MPLCPLVSTASQQTSAPLVGYVPPKIFVKIQPALLAQAKASVFRAPLAPWLLAFASFRLVIPAQLVISARPVHAATPLRVFVWKQQEDLALKVRNAQLTFAQEVYVYKTSEQLAQWIVNAPQVSAIKPFACWLLAHHVFKQHPLSAKLVCAPPLLISACKLTQALARSTANANLGCVYLPCACWIRARLAHLTFNADLTFAVLLWGLAHWFVWQQMIRHAMARLSASLPYVPRRPQLAQAFNWLLHVHLRHNVPQAFAQSLLALPRRPVSLLWVVTVQ